MYFADDHIWMLQYGGVIEISVSPDKISHNQLYHHHQVIGAIQWNTAESVRKRSGEVYSQL
jgi:hypothetical protein